ncbi:MAG: PAS domain-containing protein, partial [Polyangiaceae bacterium]|nr:PAS domain-containing protein [Polyangiaceae bacterium]
MDKPYTDSTELAASERERLYVRPSAVRRYLGALVFVAAGVGLRYLLKPILPLDVVPFVTLFPSVALAGWYGGTGPALVAAALSWSIGTFAFVVPSYTFDLRGVEGYVVAVLFAVTGAVCGISGGNLHDARHRAEKGTRQARAEEAAARESERRYRALSELVPGIVWSATPNGRVEYANAQWLAYSGRSLDAGSAEGIREACHREDAPTWDESWVRATRGGQSWQGEFRLRRHDGEYRWFSCRAEPMRDSEGTITRWT